MHRHSMLGAPALALAGVLIVTLGAHAQNPAAAPLDAIRLVGQRSIEVEDARLISMSPDGRWLAAVRPATGYARGRLCVIEVETLLDGPCADLSALDAGLRIEDVTWAPDSSRIAFAENGLRFFVDGDLWVMDVATGALRNLDDDGYEGQVPVALDATVPEKITLPVNPAFSPDGSQVAFSRSVIDERGSRRTVIAVVPAAGGEVQELEVVSESMIGIVYFGVEWAPDGERIFFSYSSLDRQDLRNGIWVMRADGDGSPRLVAHRYQDTHGPAVVAVSADGDTLLLEDPTAMNILAPGTLPFYALADPDRIDVEPLGPLGPGAVDGPQPFVSWATFSPDGRYLLTVQRTGFPDGQVWVRAVGGTDEIALVPEAIESVGPVDRGLVPTWASNGTVFLTGGGRFEIGTLLTLEGGLPE